MSKLVDDANGPLDHRFIEGDVNIELAKLGLLEKAEIEKLIKEAFDGKTMECDICTRDPEFETARYENYCLMRIIRDKYNQSILIFDLEETLYGVGLYESTKKVKLNEKGKIISIDLNGKAKGQECILQHSLRVPAVLKFDGETDKCIKAECYVFGERVTDEEFLSRRKAIYELARKKKLERKHVTMDAIELAKVVDTIDSHTKNKTILH